MIERDPAVAALLERMVPATTELRGWEGLVARATASRQGGHAQGGGRSRRITASLVFGLAVVATAAALAVAGVGPFASFHDWLTGSPGRPAPESAKRAVLQSPYGWDAFPASTDLRQLVRVSAAGITYTLYGFRSGDALCLSLRSSFARQDIPPRCTPTATLQTARRPIVFVTPDAELGPGLLSPEVSFGFVADQVRKVVITATDGEHDAHLAAGAYLWVEPQPNAGNRVVAAAAIGPHGRTRVAVPAGIYGFGGSAAARPRGPAGIEATILHPTIGWLDRHEAVGLAPSALAIRPMIRTLIAQSGFTRFIKPDPSSDVTIGVSKKRLFLAGGLWGGSNPPYFARGPLHAFYPPQYDAAQSVRFSGVAADGVAAVRIFTASGAQAEAALRDNVFTVLVAAAPPYRLVAYNAKQQVVASDVFDRQPLSSSIPTAAHRLSPLLTVRGPHGSTARFLLGREVGGGTCFGSACSVRCWELRFSNSATQRGCDQTLAKRPPGVRMASVSFYALQQVGRDIYILGRASARVRRVALRFTGGDSVFARPVKGFVLVAVPPGHLRTSVQHAWLVGYRADGTRTHHSQPIYFHLRSRPR